MNHRALWPLAAVTGCLLGGIGAAAAREPLDLVPAESLLCWHGRPLPENDPLPQEPSTLVTLLDLGTRVAGKPLDPGAQLGVRMLETLGLLIRHSHALALIDAQAAPAETDATGRQLDRLRFVLVVETKGGSDVFRRVIQKAVNEQTDSQTAVLQGKKAGRWFYQELRDRRLPDWCTIAWGDIDDHFVFAVGPEVWPAIAAVATGEAPALSRDGWVASARESTGRLENPAATQPGRVPGSQPALDRATPSQGPADTETSLRRDPPLIEIYVAAGKIRERLDPFVEDRATAFFQAWHAEGIERSWWALGFQGRALYCMAHFLSNDQTQACLYADPSIRDPQLLATIPATARYAIYRVPIGELVPRFVSSLYAIRSPAIRKSAEELWAKVQAEYGFDAQRDVLDHLGHYAVLHNDPPHPLRVPLAMTTLVEVREQPQQVRQTLETMCRAWQAGLEKAAEESGVPNPAMLRHDSDGVWYLQFGPVAGPAWTITDKYIITCWSPAALRSYLEKIGDAVGRRG